jgi:hypothetical protein
MTDREMLDLLAGDAPVPGPGYVDEIADRGRRTRRRRRRLTACGAGLGVAAVLATVVLAVQLQPHAAPGPAAASVSASSPTPHERRPRMAEAEAYAAAIRALADEVRAGGPPWPVLFVLGHTCENVITPWTGGCNPRPLTPTFRDDLVAALQSYAQAQFVADPAQVTDAARGLEIVNGGVLVTLGPIRLHEDRAEVPLAVRRSGLDGRGQTYLLSRQGQQWRIDGLTGPTWIS